MSELFEFFMVFLFGLSWPITIRKSWTARTAKGKSIMFSVLVWVGYLCGGGPQQVHPPNKKQL